MKLRHIFLLTKRLYKKAAFVFLLVLIPITVFLLGAVSGEDGSFMTIALASEDSEGALAQEIIDSLVSSSRLVKFERYATGEEAVDSVRYGECDCAWIFRSGLEERIENFVSEPTEDNFVARVVARETTVPTRIVNEKLSGALYKYAARRLYVGLIREKAPALVGVSEEELFKYYDAIGGELGLFRFEAVNESALPETGYVMSPVRGLVAIAVVFGSLAAAMYYTQDLRRGMFYNFGTSRLLLELVSVLLPTLSLALALFLSLSVAGLSAGFFKELFFSLYLALTATLFAVSVRRIFKSVRVLSAVSVLLVFLMLAVCPVFFNLSMLRPVQALFPVTHYIDLAHGTGGAFLYFGVLAILVTALHLIQKNKGIR